MCQFELWELRKIQDWERVKLWRRGGGEVFKLTIFFYDRWSRNQIEVIHNKYQSSESIIQDV